MGHRNFKATLNSFQTQTNQQDCIDQSNSLCWFQDVESGTPIDEEEYPIYSQLRFSNALIQKVNQLSKQVRFEVYQNTVMVSYFEIVLKQHREGKSFLTYFNPYIELGIEPFYWYTDHLKTFKALHFFLSQHVLACS